MKERIIVALDGMNGEQALALAGTLGSKVWGFKVNDLLIQEGVSIITSLKRFGKVFADAKLHDIPNTVGNGVKALAGAGADIITVHVSGGRAMLKAAASNAGNAKIVAVTVLTSFSEEDSLEIFQRKPLAAILDFAALAEASGVHGITCSPQELDDLREVKQLFKVTPGVRPSWYGKADDQKRVLTPKQALDKGSDFLVIGRPITGDENPAAAVQRIVEELSAFSPLPVFKNSN